jgi:hypothetical protein
MAKAAKKPRAKKRGSVGQEIFDQVEKLVAEMKIPRLQAFKRLSEKTGRRVGTVAANYYRLARKSGVPLRRRRRKGGRKARVAAVGGGGSPSIRRALAALQEIGNVLRKQEAEIARMAKQHDSLKAIRRLIGKG